MSDKWETVGAAKKPRPPKVGNGTVGLVQPAAGSAPVSKRPQKKVKHRGPRESKIAPPPTFGVDEDELLEGSLFAGLDQDRKKDHDEGSKKENAPKKPSQKQQQPAATKPKEKPRDLVSTINALPVDTLRKFFDELKNADSNGDVYFSWMKYSADALNGRLSHATTPDPSQWPNDLTFPKCQNDFTSTIQHMITESVRSQENVDIMGLSFSALLTAIPQLLQRGDAGWGYLLFLREMCRLDPDLPLRRAKTISELMESYGNKKEVGLCILWVAAHAALYSENVLKIVVKQLLPYYNFKHYKTFVLSVLNTLSWAASMGGDNLVDPDEFEEFFEASFDPKKRRDFEKFYPRIKELTLRNIRGNGSKLFSKFLTKLGDKEFSSVSHHGRETLDILTGCLEKDTTCMEKWKEQLHKYPKESVILLNFLAKNPESISSYALRLETKFIQSDEFARAAVKTPELIRVVKKLQVAFKKVEETKKRKRFSWRGLCGFLLLMMIGLLWLDVTENGKGVFAKSNSGKLLQKYGLLDEAQLFIDTSAKLLRTGFDYLSQLFRIISERVRPLLQSIGEQIEAYIPQLYSYYKLVASYFVESLSLILTFLKEKVFVGVLSPENMRKIAKESLAFLWANILFAGQKIIELVERYIQL